MSGSGISLRSDSPDVGMHNTSKASISTSKDGRTPRQATYGSRVRVVHYIVANTIVVARRDAYQREDLAKHDADLVEVVRALTTVESIGVLVVLKEASCIVQRDIECCVRRLVAHEEGEWERRLGVRS